MKKKKYFLLFVHSKEAGKLTDEECIKRFLAGEEKYFSVLVERYSPELFRYTSSYIHDRQDCEDIVQDVFTDFVLLLRSGKYSEQGKMHNLLVKMARHHVINSIDHLHLYNALFTQTDAFDSPEAGDEETYKPGREKMLRLRAALRNLTEKELQIFMLRYHAKASFEEIGKRLDMKPHTAMSIHTRTLSKLRKAIGENA